MKPPALFPYRNFFYESKFYFGFLLRFVLHFAVVSKFFDLFLIPPIPDFQLGYWVLCGSQPGSSLKDDPG